MGAGAQAWLDRQARTLSGARSGLLALAKAAGAPPDVVAAWPGARPPESALLESARVALATRRPAVQPSAGAAARIALAFRLEDGREGAVAFGLEPALAAEGPLRVLELGVAWLPAFLEPDGSARAPDAELARELVAAALAASGAEDAALAVATALATRLAAERVSVGLVDRGEPRLVALSHSASFDARSRLARALEDAMAEALDQRRTVVYPPPEGTGAALLRAHEALVQTRNAGAACTVALRSGERLVGAITVELPPGRTIAPERVSLLEDAAPIVGALLEVQRRGHRSLAAHVREAARAPLAALADPARPRVRLAAATAAGAALLLALVPVPWRVTAPATLEGTVQRVVVAPVDGYVAEARARPGDVVRRGDVLGSLDDADLRLERRRWQGKRDEIGSQIRSALARHDRTDLSTLGAQLEQAEAELARIDDQLGRARLVAPFDGVVAKGDLTQALGSPVTRGQVLFEVASLDGYRIIVEVDERDVAAVSPGQTGRLTLSALPGQVLPLSVRRVTPVATPARGRNFFRVEAALETPLDALRPGMEGVAKISTGRRSLLWIWTHGLFDWLRLVAWKWLP